ncbi:MAG: ABC transporter permease [Faecalibacterium prausnitzii]|nr:ABC transporter permease [Faecalibacterium prausnitzii]MDY2682882.1 ABC transporter permease [Faecalibacterium prausnitzii]
MIFETFRQAIQNVWSNKLRTFLTMLGIIIGVMAVIVIVGLGNGMTKSMRDSFSALGTNTLSVQVWGEGNRNVSEEDMYEIVDQNPDLYATVSPQIDFSSMGTLKIGTATFRWSTIYGVDENYTETIKNYQLAQGRGLQYMDIEDNKQVCIIGDYLNRVAFGGNGLGQTLKIGTDKFRIVGVLAPKVSNTEMQQGSDDDCVYLPYTTAMRLSRLSSPGSFNVVMRDESRANEAKSLLESQLQQLLRSENGYYIYSASEWLEEMNKMINMVIVILTGIASISLLVGGIGIMNIMLVSVTERTREIGIRKALGAKERTILAQFVVEAATTSALGGALGIALGYAVSMAANRVLPMFTEGTNITVSPSLNSIVVAFGISAGIGVLFGYLPARRAARLNPIEALRYD